MKGKGEYTNSELIEGVREKKNDVLDYILKQNYSSIRKMVRVNSGSDADASDVMQEAIVVLFRKVREGDFQLTSSLNTFLYSVSRLIWLKELKRRGFTQNIDSENLDFFQADLDVDIDRNDRLRLFREKFEELGEDCKKVLRLFSLGTPMSQIAKFMGYQSEVYAKKKKYTCKEGLVKKIRTSNQFKELAYED